MRCRSSPTAASCARSSSARRPPCGCVTADLAGQVSTYLDVLASRLDRDLRRMHVATAGQGDRNLFVSYISEVPVWKTTYRARAAEQAGRQTAAAGMGDRRQHGRRGLGQRRAVARRGRAAVVHHGDLAAAVHTAAGRAMPEQLLPSPQTHAPTLKEEKRRRQRARWIASAPPHVWKAAPAAAGAAAPSRAASAVWSAAAARHRRRRP